MDDNETDKGRQVASLRLIYDKMRKKQGSYELYNLLEKCVIEVPLNDFETKTFKELDLENTMIREIKQLAMQLSRFKPADWNKFLDVVIK
jgi:nitric oxide synthase oxygenase domain/subunit